MRLKLDYFFMHPVYYFIKYASRWPHNIRKSFCLSQDCSKERPFAPFSETPKHNKRIFITKVFSLTACTYNYVKV
jgi:hypothetical protein